MEPRIATLLDDAAVLDPISPLPLPPVNPRRPLFNHNEPPSGNDDGLHTPLCSQNVASESSLAVPASATRPSPHRLKSSVPIAEVLNDEAPSPAGPLLPTVPGVPVSHSLTQPFSGRLQDILLDPSQQGPNKRRKVDRNSRASPPALPATENALLKLPKLPQLPKKTTRRHRIPPLLQGLHQPPPLPPQARLFPPITGENDSFGRKIGEMGALRSPIGWDTSKENEVETDVSVGKENTMDLELSTGKPSLKNPERESGVAPINDKTKGNHSQAATKVVDGGVTKRKENRKRNKWSEEETKDLLQGVSKYGIGNWKKILNDDEYSFKQRTAVDLKDRFRTCCPGEASKSRTGTLTAVETTAQLSKGEKSTTVRNNDEATALGSESIPLTVVGGKPQRKARSDIHKKSSTELAEMGILSPFQPSKRRQRREFTEHDDDNLWKAFEKYGPVWHSMRDDKELGFASRHPTDLRDRFRIRFPEAYAKAGYKLKPKDGQTLKEKEKATDENEAVGTDLVSPVDENQHLERVEEAEGTPRDRRTMKSSRPATSSLRAHTLHQPLRSSFPTPLQEFSDLVSEDEGDGNQSPITLNRNIFEWADANPSQNIVPTSISASINIPTITSLVGGEIGYNLFASMDGMHIDPQALRIPLAPMQHGNSLSAIPAFLNPNPVPHHNANIAANPTTSAPPGVAPSSSAKQDLNAHFLRTPNLPTIVFPHVPVASARSTMHNLPPPADLLSGLDYDVTRSDQQQQQQQQQHTVGGFGLDDGLNFGFVMPSINVGGHASGSGLRGTGNGSNSDSVGRGLLMVDKERERGSIMDTGGDFGERSLLNSAV